MADNLRIQQSLYAGSDEITFLKNQGAVSNTVGKEGGYDQGLCDSHRNGMHKTSRPHHAKLSTAALFLDAVFEDRVSYAVSTQNDIYGELTVGNEHYSFQCDGIEVRYNKIMPHIKFQMTPFILYAIQNNMTVQAYYRQAFNLYSLEFTLRFCDSFWYDYAMHLPREVTVTDDLAIETIKAAYNTGSLVDKSSDLLCPPCSVFSDLNRRRTESGSVIKDDFDFTDYIEGRHLVHHEWAPEQMQHIRPLDYLREFVPTPEFIAIMKKIDYRIGKNMVDNYFLGITDLFYLQRDFVNLLLFGDPGAGKTALANALSAATGMPLYVVMVNEDTEDDEFIGMNKIVDGQLGFVETNFLEAFEKGGIILIEEVNLGRPNILTSMLNQSMAYPYIIKRNGYKLIERNPFTVIIGTMNVETEGVLQMNSSSSQRFTYKYEVLDPNPEDFIKILMLQGYDLKNSKYVYMAYKSIRNFLKTSEQTRKLVKEISIRQCFGALASIQEGESPKKALHSTMYGAFAVVNPKLAATINKTVLENLMDYDSFPVDFVLEN